MSKTVIEYLRHLKPPIVRCTDYLINGERDTIKDYLLYKDDIMECENKEDFIINYSNFISNRLTSKQKVILNKNFTRFADCGLIEYQYNKEEPDTPTKHPNKIIIVRTKEIIWERQPHSIVTSENDVVIETDQKGQQIFEFDPNQYGLYKINGERKCLPFKQFHKYQIDK